MGACGRWCDRSDDRHPPRRCRCIDAYAGAVPAAIVLACGIFGNITEQDIRRTVSALPMLCARDATVIWTRHRRPPDLTPTIREWFRETGFSEEAFEAPDGTFFGVGAERFIGSPRPLVPGQRMFTFVGFDDLLDRAGGAGDLRVGRVVLQQEGDPE